MSITTPQITTPPRSKPRKRKVPAPKIKPTSKIICGDICETLAQFNETQTQFEVIIADPPYNIGKDFGNNHDTMPLGDYIAWSKDWLAHCYRLLADNGVIYVYGLPEILAHIAVQYPLEAQRWLVWHYTNKTVPQSKFWQRAHESILCLWKPGTSRPQLEIDQIREPYSASFLNNAAGKKRKATPSRYGGTRGRETIYAAHHGGALPRDVLKVPALAGGAGAVERWFMCHDCGDDVFPPAELKHHREHHILKHPTQKPVALTARLLRAHIKDAATPPHKGGRALIAFAGSGAECITAEQLGIDYLGIEINPQFVEFANKWLAKIK